MVVLVSQTPILVGQRQGGSLPQLGWTVPHFQHHEELVEKKRSLEGCQMKELEVEEDGEWNFISSGVSPGSTVGNPVVSGGDGGLENRVQGCVTIPAHDVGRSRSGSAECGGEWFSRGERDRGELGGSLERFGDIVRSRESSSLQHRSEHSRRLASFGKLKTKDLDQEDSMASASASASASAFLSSRESGRSRYYRYQDRRFVDRGYTRLAPKCYMGNDAIGPNMPTGFRLSPCREHDGFTSDFRYRPMPSPGLPHPGALLESKCSWHWAAGNDSGINDGAPLVFNQPARSIVEGMMRELLHSHNLPIDGLPPALANQIFAYVDAAALKVQKALQISFVESVLPHSHNLSETTPETNPKSPRMVSTEKMAGGKLPSSFMQQDHMNELMNQRSSIHSPKLPWAALKTQDPALLQQVYHEALAQGGPQPNHEGYLVQHLNDISFKDSHPAMSEAENSILSNFEQRLPCAHSDGRLPRSNIFPQEEQYMQYMQSKQPPRSSHGVSLPPHSPNGVSRPIHSPHGISLPLPVVSDSEEITRLLAYLRLQQMENEPTPEGPPNYFNYSNPGTRSTQEQSQDLSLNAFVAHKRNSTSSQSFSPMLPKGASYAHADRSARMWDQQQPQYVNPSGYQIAHPSAHIQPSPSSLQAMNISNDNFTSNPNMRLSSDFSSSLRNIITPEHSDNLLQFQSPVSNQDSSYSNHELSVLSESARLMQHFSADQPRPVVQSAHSNHPSFSNGATEPLASDLTIDMLPPHLNCLSPNILRRILKLLKATNSVKLQDFDDKVVLKMIMALMYRFGEAECVLMLEQLEGRLSSKHIIMKNAAGYLDVAVSGHIDALMMRSNTAVSSSTMNPYSIQEVAQTTLNPVVYYALDNAIKSKLWMKWDEHVDLAIVQLLNRLPLETATRRLKEVQRRSFHGVTNVRGCINSIICPRAREKTIS
eukprot:gene25172-10803_t